MKRLQIALFPLLGLFLIACGDGGGLDSEPFGSLTLGVTDSPVDEAEHVWIQFTGTEINPEQGDLISIVYDAPKQIDLLALQGGLRDLLLEDLELDPGVYNWIRLQVDATADGIMDSYIVVDGVSYELEVSSGEQSGLKLNRPIEILDALASDFTVDFDLRKSVHQPRGRTGPSGDPVYKLRPTLRLVETEATGNILGTIDPAIFTGLECSMPEDGYAVYAYSGSDIVPDDIDDLAPEPVATSGVTLNNLSQYAYNIAYLSAGDYTIAATCHADLDEPDEDNPNVVFVGAGNVSVLAGVETVFDFVPQLP